MYIMKSLKDFCKSIFLAYTLLLLENSLHEAKPTKIDELEIPRIDFYFHTLNNIEKGLVLSLN